MIHSTLRPYQAETLDRIKRSLATFLVISAPTGFGKSYLPAQLAYEGHKVLALTKTKSLQMQYQQSYDFTLLYGKGNYQCMELGQQYNFINDLFVEPSIFCVTSDLCIVPSGLKEICHQACPYFLAKNEFVKSKAGSLNYSKFLLDRPLVESFAPEYLFLDEADELSDLVVEFSGIVLNWSSKNLKEYTKQIYIPADPQPMAIARGIEYLKSLFNSLENNKPAHPSEGGDIHLYKWHERTMEKVDITLASLEINPECWYIRSDHEHFVCKPMTARFHFKKLFQKANKIILMSGTISRRDMQDLGVKEFEFIEVPHTIPAPMRPVYDLQAPAMGYKTSESDRKKWANIIKDTINKCPERWSGIVHTTSKNMAYELQDRMSLDRPVWVPARDISTEEALTEWVNFYQDNIGAIAICWQLNRGCSLGDQNINIVAKVPYPSFSDGFDKARFEYDRMGSLQRVANDLMQREGRIRRGFTEHYGPGAEKLSAIADSRWRQVGNYLAPSFVRSIVV